MYWHTVIAPLVIWMSKLQVNGTHFRSLWLGVVKPSNAFIENIVSSIFFGYSLSQLYQCHQHHPAISPRPQEIKPTFVNSLTNQPLQFGATAYFECKVNGYPPPEILWTRPRTPTRRQDKIQIHVRSVQWYHNTDDIEFTRSRRRWVKVPSIVPLADPDRGTSGMYNKT